MVDSRVWDEVTARTQNNWSCEHGHDEKDCKEGGYGVHKSTEALRKCHVFDEGAKDAESQFEGCLHRANRLSRLSGMANMNVERKALTHRVRCFRWLVSESGTVPNWSGSWMKAVFQPDPRSILEQQTSSASDPMGNPPIDCRAALLST